MKEKLQSELGTASNIKSRVNRQSVQRALKRCIERLKIEKQTPPNGAILLCGTFDLPPTSDPPKELETNDAIFYFEPPLPVKRFVYFCDKRFHLDKILPLYQCDENSTEKYGICIVGGSEAHIFYYLPDIDQFRSADSAKGALRNKHGRGGYSQNRYQRLRENDVHALVVKMTEMCEKACLSPSGLLVKGLVLVGSGERKKQVKDRLKSLKGDQLPEGFVTLVASDGAQEGSLLAAKDVILDLLRPKEEREAEKEVAKMVELSPDLLVFGEKEVRGGLEEELLRRVFIVKDRIDSEMEDLLASCSAEVVCFNVSGFLESFGGMIGVRYF